MEITCYKTVKENVHFTKHSLWGKIISAIASQPLSWPCQPVLCCCVLLHRHRAKNCIFVCEQCPVFII